MRMITPHEIVVGMHITIYSWKEKGYHPLTGHEILKKQFVGDPLKVMGISLPFLACLAGGQHRITLDTRDLHLQELDKGYVSALEDEVRETLPEEYESAGRAIQPPTSPYVREKARQH